ncbi:MAG: hypothetical protein CL927_18245 [Deltaproteobacteria bacterium]|nr:hypothetical protein [Deltaproteobacteria bacterium]HCH62820.1 hypothetical protein [Deltaproteobacteria bacterium]
MIDLPIQCTCGSVRGTLLDVAPSTVQNLVCHCIDCRSTLRHLGRANDLLTEHGGTAVVHSTPARMQITHGHTHVGLLRLSPKGLLRFYATCCNTPIASMLDDPRQAFVSIARCILPSDADTHLGPAVGVRGRSAIGNLRTLDAAHNVPAWLVARIGWRLAKQRLQGQARPSAFHAADGTCIAVATILTLEQRTAAQHDPR